VRAQRECGDFLKEEPMAERQYDVVVIGAGSTGENVAARAVKVGLSAVVVEAELASVSPRRSGTSISSTRRPAPRRSPSG